MPRVKTVHFCELKWQAWAVTFFSYSLGSADVGLCTEAFSQERPASLSSFLLQVHCRSLLKSMRARNLH